MRLLNVRLDDEDARLVRNLRERGISISNVVRGAIRSEAKRTQPAEMADPTILLAEMRARHPRPTGLPPAEHLDSTDRRQVGKAIREKLRRRG